MIFEQQFGYESDKRRSLPYYKLKNRDTGSVFSPMMVRGLQAAAAQ